MKNITYSGNNGRDAITLEKRSVDPVQSSYTSYMVVESYTVNVTKDVIEAFEHLYKENAKLREDNEEMKRQTVIQPYAVNINNTGEE